LQAYRRFLPWLATRPVDRLSVSSKNSTLSNVNCQGLRDTRQAEWRILYEIDDAIHLVTVLRVEHRADVCKAVVAALADLTVIEAVTACGSSRTLTTRLLS
jgi:mRNA-degrading endonuclease RelE of RelBE toxin-antitoxin system